MFSERTKKLKAFGPADELDRIYIMTTDHIYTFKKTKKNRFYHKNGETFDCKDLTRLSTPTVSPGPPTASDCPAGSTWSGVLLRPGSERANLLGTVR